MGSLDDTICAVATPLGEGGVGIVRLSGVQALPIASRIVRLRSGQPLETLPPFKLSLADFLWDFPENQESNQIRVPSKLDEVLVVAMRAPRSYTGEDVVEIHCHGGPMVVQAVCEALIRVGARLAEPGEFTKRGFLNGRLDLTQAEAVLDTIRANSIQSLKVAQEHLHGGFSRVVSEQRDRLLRYVAHLEAGLDFVDEDIQFINIDDLRNGLLKIETCLNNLLETAHDGRIIREGVRTAIIGRPNVGKSSLLNRLLDTDRAIVSHIPGTTRDVLEEAISVKGILVRLFDTAGLRESEDELENEGINRAARVIDEADVLLVTFDKSQPLSEQDMNFIQQHSEKPRVMVLNKTDLPSKWTLDAIEPFLSKKKVEGKKEKNRVEFVEVSALKGTGISRLRSAITSLALGGRFEAGDSVFVTKMRHKTLLQKAEEGLQNALKAIHDEASPECIALELRVSLEALGEIVGTVSNEDILDQIFREFCIGK